MITIVGDTEKRAYAYGGDVQSNGIDINDLPQGCHRSERPPHCFPAPLQNAVRKMSLVIGCFLKEERKQKVEKFRTLDTSWTLGYLGLFLKSV